MSKPALDAHRARWDATGWSVIEGVVPPDALSAALEAVEHYFPSADAFAAGKDPKQVALLQSRSDAVLPRFPFGEGALDDLVLSDALLDLAETFLETDNPRLYQGLLSGKYADGAVDAEQLLHADYGNHTLLVPRHEPGFEQLELFVYLTDVTPGTGATRLVPLERTAGIPVERTYLSVDEYADLYAAEVPAAGPAGSVLAYRPDVYHRGVAITEPGTARFMLHVSFKPPATDWLGFQSWPEAAEQLAWHQVVARSSFRGLLALGFPPPGHPYWTERTLVGVGARYPTIDLGPWGKALAPNARP